MSTTVVTGRALRMTPCRGQDLAVAADFRDRVFRSRSSLRFDRVLEDRCDRDAILVGLLSVDGEIAATARSIRFPAAGSVLDGDRFQRFGPDSQVGRLAASPGADSARNALTMLSLGALWISEFTSHRRYISYAHEKLVPLYVAVGGIETGETVSIAGREARYQVVVGTYFDAAQIGCRLLGLTSGQSYRAIGMPRRSQAV